MVINLFAGVIHAAKSDGHKSDTDSGKGSIYDEKRIVEQFLVGQNKLRVTRCSDDKFKAMCQPKAAKVDVIGFERENINHHEKINTSERRPVVTSRKDTILRKRDLRRRNTIDLSHLPGDWQHHFDLPVSKTIHCTQNAQIGQKYATGASMPGKQDFVEKRIRNREVREGNVSSYRGENGSEKEYDAISGRMFQFNEI